MRVGHAALLVAGSTVLSAVAGSARPAEPRFERAIELEGEGRVALRLDARVYESARADLGDLRVVDEHGALVPFLIDRGEASWQRMGVRPIDDARVPADVGLPLREHVLAPRVRRAEDAKAAETWLVLELGARHQPFHAIDLDVADGRFFREVLVEARRERTSAAGGPALDWLAIGRGAVYRREHEGRLGECLRIPVCGRERVLRLRLRNRDDRPLAIRGVSLLVPSERVVFEAAPGHSYLLRYGASELAAPAFDLERTVLDVAAWAAGAREGELGEEQVARPTEAPRVPWSERHPALLWAGLLVVVAALGALTYRAIRRTS